MTDLGVCSRSDFSTKIRRTLSTLTLGISVGEDSSSLDRISLCKEVWQTYVFEKFAVILNRFERGTESVFTQKSEDQKEHVVGWQFYIFNKAERNYPTSEKEMLAVLKGVHCFHSYLVHTFIHTETRPVHWSQRTQGIAPWGMHVTKARSRHTGWIDSFPAAVAGAILTVIDVWQRRGPDKRLNKLPARDKKDAYQLLM